MLWTLRSDFSTPMSRVRSITVVYIERKITRNPMATAKAIMLFTNGSNPGRVVAVICEIKSLTGRLS